MVRPAWLARPVALFAAYTDPVERARRAERKERARIEREDKKKLRTIAKEIARATTEILTGVGYAHAYVNPGQRRKRYLRATR